MSKRKLQRIPSSQFSAKIGKTSVYLVSTMHSQLQCMSHVCQAHKRQLTSTACATPLMTPTTALGLSIRLSMFELRETGDWDIFLGPPERARAETRGADQWVLKRRECSGFARVNKVTSASLGYPLSVVNKNSTLILEMYSI